MTWFFALLGVFIAMWSSAIAFPHTLESPRNETSVIQSLDTFPNTFSIVYQTHSQASLFYVENKEGQVLGTVKVVSFGENAFFSLTDKAGQLVGTAEIREIDPYYALIFNAAGEKIASFNLRHKILSPAEYLVFDPQLKLIAKGTLNIIGNRFTLSEASPKRRELATFSRPRFKLIKDYWCVTIHEPEKLEKSIYIFMATYQTFLNRNIDRLAGYKSLQIKK